MTGRSRSIIIARSVAGVSLLLCLVVLGFWVAGLRIVRPDPLWLHVTASHGRVQYGIGSLDGQMELRRVVKDDQPLAGPHCGERAACAAFEQQFPPAVRHQYLGCTIGREPVIDIVGRDEQLVKTGTASFLIVPHGVAAFTLGVLPLAIFLRFLIRRSKKRSLRN